MGKLTLGLDIGVSSVGYGIINEESGKIVDAGVRLFPQADKNSNLLRRTMRGSRRLTRRRKYRLEVVDSILRQIGFEKPSIAFYQNCNPYQLRVKGLKEQLMPEELYIAIMHLVKHRGISYLSDMEDADTKNELIEQNLNACKEKYICEIQLERLKKEKHVRGEQNIFETKEYLKELTALFKTQKQFYSQITDEVIDDLCDILTRKRKYFMGPGSENSRTNYGCYKVSGENLDNLFEILIGKCKIFKDQYRAPSESYTAQLFNFLNDLNNIKVNGEKLTYDQKKKIYEIVFQSKSINMLKIISKVTDVPVEMITGYRINNKGNPEFHKFESYRKFLKQCEILQIPIDMISVDLYDHISDILTLETERSRIYERLQKEYPILKEEVAKKISKMDLKLWKGWHSLSLKAMHEIMEDLWYTNKEQSTLFHERKLIKPNTEKYIGKKQIPTDFVDEEIYNPICRRSIRQAIQVLNAIRKRYGEMNTIVIETTREFNQDKLEIAKMNRENANRKQKAIQEALKQYSFEPNQLNGQAELMILLWSEQDGKSMYSNTPISIYDLICHPDKFDIDHIIPQSISFDDSKNNKVLCLREENRLKGNRTPYRYLISGNGSITYDVFKAKVVDLCKRGLISNKKLSLLLTEEDINKWEVRQKFIHRNLTDTSYAIQIVLNTIQDYMKVNQIPTNVVTVKGAITGILRSKWKLKKDRSEHKHHAVDALIIASTNHAFKGTFYKRINQFLLDERTGEILYDDDILYERERYQEPYPSFIKQLRELNPRFSYKVDKKINRGISDQTIKSSRLYDGEEYVITKFHNIYDKDGAKLKKLILESPERILLYQHDKETYALFEDIVKHYPKEDNPFRKYYEEFHVDQDPDSGKIRRYSKNGNGPVIHNIRYLDSKLKSHISLTQLGKYPESKHNVFLLQKVPYRIDIYYCEDGYYRYAGIYQHMFCHTKTGMELRKDLYEEELKLKGIHKDDCFQFSLYKGDIFEIEDEKGIHQYTFKSNNNDRRNYLEYQYISYRTNRQEILVIGKKIKAMRKIYTDILGYPYYNCNEKLILDFNEKGLTNDHKKVIM